MTKNEESGKTRRTSSDSCKNQKNHTRAWRKTNISNIAPSGANNWFSVANNWFSVAIRFHKIYLFGPESGKVVRSKPKLAGRAWTYSGPSSIQENSTDPQAIVFRGVRFWLFFWNTKQSKRTPPNICLNRCIYHIYRCYISWILDSNPFLITHYKK